MLVPALNVGCPGDQRIAVPETDRVSVPLRNIRSQRKLSVQVDDAPHVAATAAQKCNDLWSHDDAAGFGACGPLAHEPLGPAVRSGPLVSGVDTLVIDLLHHALLMFRRQQGQQSWNLIGARVVPDATSFRSILPIRAVPFGHGFVRMFGRAAARFRVGSERLVMLFRRLERIGAHDVLARPIHLAISPPGCSRRLASDSWVGRAGAGAAAAHVGDLSWSVAAPVPLVFP